MSVYEIVTQKIMDLLEQGVVPWRRPWKLNKIPTNYISKRAYSGINVWILTAANFKSHYFLTFNQIKKLKGHLKAGSKSQIVVFFKRIIRDPKESETKSDKTQTFPFLQYYRVFNADQIEGIDFKASDQDNQIREFTPIQEAENIVTNFKTIPEIRTNEIKAYYHPGDDFVGMPKKESFEHEKSYYSVLFHELIHSTGHESRLNREGVTNLNFFGDHNYSKEELIAEMGASYLCATAGIEQVTIANSASYIQAWLKFLSNDKRAVVWAASHAQKAADYILQKQISTEATEGE